MSSGLKSLDAAFRRCVGELGMWTAARLFLAATRAHGGDDAVAELRDALGAEFPVLDVLAEGAATPPDVAPLQQACAGLRRVVVVGVEADWLERFVSLLPRDIELALLLDTTFPLDVERVRASWRDRMIIADLESFQRYAGARSALVTTVYGSDGYAAVVSRIWLRLHGEDVRTQFRSLLGFNVLGDAMQRYPRWLVETAAGDFTDIITAEA